MVHGASSYTSGGTHGPSTGCADMWPMPAADPGDLRDTSRTWIEVDS